MFLLLKASHKGPSLVAKLNDRMPQFKTSFQIYHSMMTIVVSVGLKKVSISYCHTSNHHTARKNSLISSHVLWNKTSFRSPMCWLYCWFTYDTIRLVLGHFQTSLNSPKNPKYGYVKDVVDLAQPSNVKFVVHL